MRRTDLRLAGLIGAGSCVWLLVVSSWMGSGAGGVPLARDDVFFASDTGSWLARIVGERHRPLPNLEVAAHPAALAIWRPPGRLMSAAAARIGLDARLAGRTLVALVAAAGIGALVLVARAHEVGGLRLWALFCVYLLSAANVIVALPEYYGVSHGLMALYFAGHMLLLPGPSRRWSLGALGALIAGTTITNAVLPLMGVSVSRTASRAGRVLTLVALIVSAPAALVLVGQFAGRDGMPGARVPFARDVAAYAGMFTRWQSPAQPGSWFEEVALGAVHPVVAPPAALRVSTRGDRIRFQSRALLARYTVVGMIAVAGWVALFLGAAIQAAPGRGPQVVWLLSWIAFNLAFHSVWGDELFLYTPHWSWALFGVVLLGAGRLPLAFVLATCAAMIPAQVQMLAALRHLAGLAR